MAFQPQLRITNHYYNSIYKILIVNQLNIYRQIQQVFINFRMIRIITMICG